MLRDPPAWPYPERLGGLPDREVVVGEDELVLREHEVAVGEDDVVLREHEVVVGKDELEVWKADVTLAEPEAARGSRYLPRVDTDDAG
jgi:hypothetical protein